MEAIGRLAGGVAHDLNNVLAIMSGFGSLLVDDLDGPARGYAERIVDAGERGKGVVQRLLDFARRDTADRRERTDLGTLLERTGGLMRAAVPQTAELVLQKAAQPVLVEANASLVEQALINLCVNARDALPSAAGSITVSVEAVELDGRRAEALRAAGLDADGVRVEGDDTGGKLWRGLLRAGPFARVSVRDDGAGMSAQTLRRIFDPMFTTKAPGKGTGLGMSTIAQMAYAHGGAIAVDSRVGVGTEVAVYLPLAEARAATAPAAIPFHAQIDPRPAAVSEPAASECILLVDDEPDLLACTRTQLERAGLRVLVADGAESAMDLHASHAGEIAAVVTDYAMPGRSGVDLARALHASDPDLAVVVCTGVVEDLDPDAAEAAGVDAVLRKPLRFDELFDLLGFDKAA
jgi:nitrogen-specific signal transduction histidine kinase/CheY-like chemotaxis protein